MKSLREKIIQQYMDDNYAEVLLLFEKHQKSFFKIEDDNEMSSAVINSYYFRESYKSCYYFLNRRIEKIEKDSHLQKLHFDEYYSLILTRVDVFRRLSLKKWELKSLGIMLQLKQPEDLTLEEYYRKEMDRYFNKIIAIINNSIAVVLFLIVFLNEFVDVFSRIFYIFFLLSFAVILLFSSKLTQLIKPYEQKALKFFVLDIWKYPKKLL